MRRPAEQTKLLFLYFLRSTAAALANPRPPFSSSGCHSGMLAVGNNGGSSSSSSSSSLLVGGSFRIRAMRSRGGGGNPNSGISRTTTSRMAFRQASSSSSSQMEANNNDGLSPNNNNQEEETPLIQTGHITFRLARRTDVPGIQQCNLATLPENYNANFYVNHMRTWPELCLVAEHIPEGYHTSSSADNAIEEVGLFPNDLEDDIISSPWEFYNDNLNDNTNTNNRKRKQKKKKEIVGYILGKVEERPVNPPPRQIFPPSAVSSTSSSSSTASDEEEMLLDFMNGGNSRNSRYFPPPQQPPPPPLMEKVGHVTSLAVHSHARRLGIASSLLEQLHHHLYHCYHANAVGLHVRISNKAAVKLYVEGMGYDVADIIPMYYGDGEDAYFMRKDVLNGGDSGGGGGGEYDQRRRFIKQQQHQQQQQQQGRQQTMRGERGRNEWVNRRSRKRDVLSEEERGWYDSNDNNRNANEVSSIQGRVQRSFRSLWNGSGDSNSNSNSNINSNNHGTNNGGQGRFRRSPPCWETGPEELRLPRYSKVIRSGNDLENNNNDGTSSTQDRTSTANGGEDDSMSYDARMASGSV